MKKLIITFFFLLVNLFGFAQVPTYVPTTGLKAWYNLSDYNDSSGNGNHLSSLENDPILTTDRFGTTNSAYSFPSGSRLFRNNPNFQLDYQQNFTVSIWLYTSDINGVCFFSGNGVSNNFISMISLSNPNVTFGVNSQGQSWFLTPTSFFANQWVHIVGVYSERVLRIYKNGIFMDGIAYSDSASSSILPFYLGGDYNNGSYQGKIDDVGIWDRALTQTEISTLFSGNLSTNSFTENDLVLFPNPVNDYLNISLSKDKIIDKVLITDVLGKIVFEQNLFSESINVSQLQNGIYNISLYSSNEVFSKKFTKK